MDPNTLVGFDVEIADLLATRARADAAFRVRQLHSIDQSVARGDADIGLSGIEDTAARRPTMAVTVPYYAFREVLERARRRRGAVSGRSAISRAGASATLGGTIAYEILLRAEREYGLTAVSYEDDVHPYSIWCSAAWMPCCSTTSWRTAASGPQRVHDPAGSVASSHYVGVLSPANAALRDRVNEILRRRCGTARSNEFSANGRSGTTISRRCTSACWRAKRSRRSCGPTPRDAASTHVAVGRRRSGICRRCSARRSSPFAVVHSMALAVALGVLIASGRVYGKRVVRARC